MKKHLEYQDEKSHKFWEIEVKDNSYTVTYGKIGTKGQSKTKTFDTAEAAKKDAEKVMKAKVKKGYIEVSNKEITYKTLTYAEAEKSYQLKDYHISYNFYGKVLVFEGNTVIDGDFINWAKKIKQIDSNNGMLILLFTGNLTVNGDVVLHDFNIAVLGNLTCDYLEVAEPSFNLIVGNAIIKYALSSADNDTYTDILGETKVPFYFNDDNYSTINYGKNTISFYQNELDNHNIDFLLDYGNNPVDFINPKYLQKSTYHNEIYFDFDLFLKALKEGKSPFVNIADKDFSLDFEKEDLLKKIKGE